ncbi:MAG: hypothetical protein R3F34_13415 [Planctomycetota bacterium]
MTTIVPSDASNSVLRALGRAGLRIVHGARSAMPAAALVALPSCAVFSQPLEHEPWSTIGAGTQTVGVSSGWAVYEAKVELDDLDGTPALGSGSDTTDLVPVFGAALKYQYFFSPRFALGGIVERRTFDPDPVQPLASPIDGDDYTTYHFLLTSRFFTDPLGEDGRWKAFGGFDLGYIPKVDLDATVEYAPGFVERITLKGDEYFTIGAVAGLSYLVNDWMTFEMGAFYEWSIDPSEDVITLNIPDGLGGTNANHVDGKVFPQGLIGFPGVTFYFDAAPRPGRPGLDPTEACPSQ